MELLTPAEILAHLYRRVYSNVASRILLAVNGREWFDALEADFRALERTQSYDAPHIDGLYAEMVTEPGNPPVPYLIMTVPETVFYRPKPEAGWLASLIESVEADKHTIRIVNLGDLPRELLMAELAGVAVEVAAKYPENIMRPAHEGLVRLGRTKLSQTLFLLPSEDSSYLAAFMAEIQRDWTEMPMMVLVES